MKLAKAAIAASVAALIWAPTANANPLDDQYLRDLQKLGLIIEDRDGVLSNAHVICERVWQGITRYEVSHQIDVATEGIDYTQSEAVVALTILYYCLPSDA